MYLLTSNILQTKKGYISLKKTLFFRKYEAEIIKPVAEKSTC